MNNIYFTLIWNPNIYDENNNSQALGTGNRMFQIQRFTGLDNGMI